MNNNLNIEVRPVPIPDKDLTRAILALNCLLSSPEPYGEDEAQKWQLLYELGMIQEGKLIIPPNILLARLGREA